MKPIYLLLVSSLSFYCAPPKVITSNEKQETIENDEMLNKLINNPNTKYTAPIIVYDKLAFGNGYNSASGVEYFSILEYKDTDSNTEIMSNATGNSGFTEFQIIETKSELKNSLDISKSLNVKASHFGAKASYSRKEKYLNETELNQFNKVAVASARYINDPRVMINPAVKMELISLANQDPEKFMLIAGDMFVSKIYTGGSVYGIFNLNERTNSEKTKNETFINASLSYMKNSISTSQSKTKINELFNATSAISSQIITEGGADSTPSTPSFEAFLEYISRFKSEVSTLKGAPVVVYVQLDPYENIAGFPKIDFSPIRVKQRDFLIRAEKINDLIENSISNGLFVVNNPEVFKQDNLSFAKDSISKYYDAKAKLNKIVIDAQGDFRKLDSIQLEELERLKYFSPSYIPTLDNTISVLLNASFEPQIILENSDVRETELILKLYGQIESSIYNDLDSRVARDISYHKEEMLFKDQPFTGRKDYKERVKPYYNIIFRDVNDLSKILYNKPWDGNDVKIFDNVRVEVQLINEFVKYYYYEGNKRKTLRYTREYLKHLGFENPRIASKNPPFAKVTIVDPETKRNNTEGLSDVPFMKTDLNIYFDKKDESNKLTYNYGCAPVKYGDEFEAVFVRATACGVLKDAELVLNYNGEKCSDTEYLVDMSKYDSFITGKKCNGKPIYRYTKK